MDIQKKIFIAFFRSGILGFGGGPSAIPLVQKEVVNVYELMDDDEFSDMLALANALPGPINTKMAGYIGYQVGGWFGMMNALVASVIPTVAMMIFLLTALNAYKDKPWVHGISKAVVPVVIVMMGVLTWDFVERSKITLGWPAAIGFLIVSIFVLEVINIHPATFIALLLIAALLRRDNKQKGSHSQ